jgi:hypothetical protein
MAEQLIADLADLMVDTLQVERMLTEDGFGGKTYSAPENLPCRLKGNHQIVRGFDGEEHLSTVEALMAGVFNLDAEDKFTLVPSVGTFNPTSPTAINIKVVPDENGPHHEKVFF